jgi:transcription antitermination factor NusG
LQLHINNIKGQLAIMGIPAASADRALAGGSVTADLAIRSPVSGIVTFRDITLGERVEPSKKLFSVVDLSPIWVLIDVFQEQLPKIRLGQSVKVISPSLQTIQGQISSIDSNVDPVKKTVHVRVVAQNQEGILRPGAFVNAEIVLGSTPSGDIVVPSMAVVESGGKHLVYQRHEKHFEPIEVQMGRETNGKTEIVSGIGPGTEIVIEGARQLLAQSMLKTRTEEHEGPGHDEHDAHDEHKETMEHVTKPEVSMITMFMAGLATACAAMGSIFLIRTRFRKKTTIVREKPKEKINA